MSGKFRKISANAAPQANFPLNFAKLWDTQIRYTPAGSNEQAAPGEENTDTNSNTCTPSIYSHHIRACVLSVVEIWASHTHSPFAP